jgi:hypothetical protein
MSKPVSYKAITSDEVTANMQEVKGGQVERQRKKKQVAAPKMGVPFYSWRVEGQCEPGVFHNPKPDSGKIKITPPPPPPPPSSAFGRRSNLTESQHFQFSLVCKSVIRVSG